MDTIEMKQVLIMCIRYLDLGKGDKSNLLKFI